MRRFTLVCDDRQARRVERLATRYGLTEREVLRQLIDLGFESLDPGEDESEGERESESQDPTLDG